VGDGHGGGVAAADDVDDEAAADVGAVAGDDDGPDADDAAAVYDDGEDDADAAFFFATDTADACARSITCLALSRARILNSATGRGVNPLHSQLNRNIAVFLVYVCEGC